jgi:hypothetical protein
MRPDQDAGTAGVAHDHVAILVHLDAKPGSLGRREQVEDRAADGLVLGRPVRSGDGQPLDRLPQVVRGDGVEDAPDGSGQGRRVGSRCDEPHHGNSSRNSIRAAWNAAGSLT